VTSGFQGATAHNLYARQTGALDAEVIEPLVEGTGCRLERIVSLGHATPPGQWYDQARAEWVVVLTGAAGLRFEDESAPRVLGPGDWLLIAAHRRHRVEWTDSEQPTVWLALHYE
jgi:cupin 2 domain-containing protein